MKSIDFAHAELSNIVAEALVQRTPSHATMCNGS
jgi:hypothetical protein